MVDRRLPNTDEARQLRAMAAVMPEQLEQFIAQSNSEAQRCAQRKKWSKAHRFAMDVVVGRRILIEVDKARPFELAVALGAFATYAMRDGLTFDAGSAADEVVELCERLMPWDLREARQLADDFRACGLCVQATAITQRVIGAYRVLAEENPDHEPDLAAMLDQLVWDHYRTESWSLAREPAAECVELCRRIAAATPAYRPQLARALTSLSMGLSSCKDPSAAQFGEESVALYRTLVAEDPKHVPAFAEALTQRSRCDSDRGRWADSIEATREAIELLDAAPRTQSTLTLLAELTLWHSGTLRDTGDIPGALAIGKRSYRLHWQAVAADRTEVIALAGAMLSMSATWARAGRRRKAIRLGKKSIRIYRRAAVDDPHYEDELIFATKHLRYLILDTRR
ncbi:hypothetical protein ACFWU5_06555 [Nocardia sp. NPDC058640]|uniref:hypothetical protein n=1 Tax=Nocardia sp. NPDC058640 TaxID=3346571 RepID=UPI00364F255B